MLNELEATKKIVIGMKQVIKAAKMGQLEKAYIAADADEFIKNKLLDEFKQNNVTYETADTMKHLGEACRIQVGAATAGILK